MNLQTYLDYQTQIQDYEQQQNRKVINAANKFREYLEEIDKVDANHQQDALAACILVVAEKMKWGK